MDTRSAKFKQQLRERDAEINRLQRELRVRVYTILLEFLNTAFLCTQDQSTSEDESVATIQSPYKKPKVNYYPLIFNRSV